MKKLLLIILIGTFIMLKPINAIIKDSIGNIIYRDNVVAGIVETDNGDGSYDVFISESDRAYPKIFTLSADPNLAAGDKVRILYKDGCKELPIILPPVAVGIARYIYVVYENFLTNKVYINVYDLDGVYQTQWEIEFTELYYGDNVLCVDVDGNVYTITIDNRSIKKRDSDGNLILTKTETNYIYNIAAGPDGYIYTLEFDSAFNDGYISKRNAATLISEDIMVIDATGAKAYDGLIIDSSSNFYVTNDTDGRYEKWTWLGGLIASRNSTSVINDGGLGVAGTKLGSLDVPGRHPITIPLALDENETDGVLDIITRPDKVGCIANYFIYAGRDNVNDRWVGKYDSNLVRVWTTQIIDTSVGIGSVNAYPF